jgi:hypothetical protein
MIKLWLKHYIYEISIGVLFSELLKNFHTPPMGLLYLSNSFYKLQSEGIINNFTLSVDSDTGHYRLEIDAPVHIKLALAAKLGEITND